MPERRRRPVTKSGKPRKRKGVKLEPTSFEPAQLRLGDDAAAEVKELSAQIEGDGRAGPAPHRGPLGGNPLLFAALPVDKIEPTPFQRDVSDAHVLKLTRAMDKTRRYLDPIIAVREAGRYHTPNGGHRLTALKELGAKSILALVVPEKEVAYQILALNIEKAHNLREKSLEVMRMVRDLAQGGSKRKETDLTLELEEPALVTLGFAYDQRGRLSGGASAPALRKVDGWIEGDLSKAVAERERRAGVILAFDDAVSEAVEKLRARGLTSPYLKAFVVARVNPLRFMKGAAPPFDELLATMTKRVRGMKTDKINSQDLARTGGAPDES